MELWIAGKQPRQQDAPYEWEFMGVFDSYERAAAVCAMTWRSVARAVAPPSPGQSAWA